MGETERQVQNLAFHLSLVTHTDQLQLALEALGDTHHHVVDQCTGGTGHGTGLLIAVATGETQPALSLDDLHGRMQLHFQTALGTLDRQQLTIQLDFDTRRQLDGVFSNARHAYTPLEYGAEDFATDTGGTSSTISHHTLVGGNDRHTQPTTYFRQLIDGLVLTQARTTGALELFNDRTAFEIFQLDGQQRLGFAAHLETRNVTFVLQNVGNCHLQLRGRHAYDGLFSHLGITDTS